VWVPETENEPALPVTVLVEVLPSPQATVAE